MDELRVLFVTFPGQGHINPSLQPAKRLAATGLKVTFLTDSSAFTRMGKATTAPPPPGLTFAGYSEGAPTAFKTADDVNDYMVELRRLGSRAVADIITSAAANGQP